MMGWCSATFYRYKKSFENGGETAVCEISRKKPIVKNRVPWRITRTNRRYGCCTPCRVSQRSVFGDRPEPLLQFIIEPELGRGSGDGPPNSGPKTKSWGSFPLNC